MDKTSLLNPGYTGNSGKRAQQKSVQFPGLHKAWKKYLVASSLTQPLSKITYIMILVQDLNLWLCKADDDDAKFHLNLSCPKLIRKISMGIGEHR